MAREMAKMRLVSRQGGSQGIIKSINQVLSRISIVALLTVGVGMFDKAARAKDQKAHDQQSEPTSVATFPVKGKPLRNSDASAASRDSSVMKVTHFKPLAGDAENNILLRREESGCATFCGELSDKLVTLLNTAVHDMSIQFSITKKGSDKVNSWEVSGSPRSELAKINGFFKDQQDCLEKISPKDTKWQESLSRIRQASCFSGSLDVSRFTHCVHLLLNAKVTTSRLSRNEDHTVEISIAPPNCGSTTQKTTAGLQPPTVEPSVPATSAQEGDEGSGAQFPPTRTAGADSDAFRNPYAPRSWINSTGETTQCEPNTIPPVQWSSSDRWILSVLGAVLASLFSLYYLLFNLFNQLRQHLRELTSPDGKLQSMISAIAKKLEHSLQPVIQAEISRCLSASRVGTAEPVREPDYEYRQAQELKRLREDLQRAKESQQRLNVERSRLELSYEQERAAREKFNSALLEQRQRAENACVEVSRLEQELSELKRQTPPPDPLPPTQIVVPRKLLSEYHQVLLDEKFAGLSDFLAQWEGKWVNLIRSPLRLELTDREDPSDQVLTQFLWIPLKSGEYGCLLPSPNHYRRRGTYSDPVGWRDVLEHIYGARGGPDFRIEQPALAVRKGDKLVVTRKGEIELTF